MLAIECAFTCRQSTSVTNCQQSTANNQQHLQRARNFFHNSSQQLTPAHNISTSKWRRDRATSACQWNNNYMATHNARIKCILRCGALGICLRAQTNVRCHRLFATSFGAQHITTHLSQPHSRSAWSFCGSRVVVGSRVHRRICVGVYWLCNQRSFIASLVCPLFYLPFRLSRDFVLRGHVWGLPGHKMRLALLTLHISASSSASSHLRLRLRGCLSFIHMISVLMRPIQFDLERTLLVLLLFQWRELSFYTPSLCLCCLFFS